MLSATQHRVFISETRAKLQPTSELAHAASLQATSRISKTPLKAYMISLYTIAFESNYDQLPHKSTDPIMTNFYDTVLDYSGMRVLGTMFLIALFTTPTNSPNKPPTTFSVVCQTFKLLGSFLSYKLFEDQ